jgi:branched-chain amino acid transport system substrate-binding protein
MKRRVRFPVVDGARVSIALAAAALATVLVPATTVSEVPPHLDAREHRAIYAGPGRDDPAPVGLDEILIGYFGPSDPDDPEGGDAWLAAGMAIEEANALGGYDGLPYRLVPAWSATPWGNGVTQLTRIVYDDGVWAIVGSIDGASTHLAETVATKARLTLVSPGSTDVTVNYANVPWMFSCMPGDDALQTALADGVVDRVGGGTLVVISATDHDSHHAAAALLAALADRRRPPGLHLEIDAGAAELAGPLERIVAAEPEAVVVVAGPRDSARIVTAVRERLGDAAIFGGPPMARRVFVEEAGGAAEGVVFPLPCDPSHADGEFGRAYQRRFGRSPDCVTAQTYDATRMVVEAIGNAGLNRARIVDEVARLSPRPGAAGPIEWGAAGRNRRDVVLGTVNRGRVVPVARGCCPSRTTLAE